jgi:hypothetical protein
MAKAGTRQNLASREKRKRQGGSVAGSALSAMLPQTPSKTGIKVQGARIQAVMRGAEKAGLLREKDGRITGRVSTGLIKEAKARTGIQSDTELIAFALANVALQDNFAEEFSKLEGTISPELDLEF